MSQKFACTLGDQIGIQIYDQNLNSRKLLEREIPSCGFNRVGLKGGQNSLKRRESWRACLSIQYASKHMIRFKFQESSQS